MFNPMHELILGTIVLLAGMAGVLAEEQTEDPVLPRVNMARGATYVMWPQPSYAHCTDPGDRDQLTDGQLAQGHFWTQQGTVGWPHAPYVTIVIDLGKLQPIAGASFRTAAGAAGVQWPAAIRIHVSDDGKIYREVGDLVAMDGSNTPSSKEYAVRRFVASAIQTRGRYVRFVVIPCGPYVFADEIEVFRGADEWLEREPAGQPVGDIEQCSCRYRVESGIRRRFIRDVASLSDAIDKADIPIEKRRFLIERLSRADKRLAGGMEIADPISFRTILPLTGDHAELFRIQADLWKAEGAPEFFGWSTCQWDPMNLFTPLSNFEPGQIEVHTMKGEFRSAAFNLANSTQVPILASIRIDNIPGSPLPEYITVHKVPWTDTVAGEPVAAALPLAERQTHAWTVRVLPGLVQQVWLTFHVKNLPAGQYRGDVMITSQEGHKQTIPLHLQVYPVSFPSSTTLLVGGWSYTDGEGSRGVTLENRRQLLDHLQSRFVNAPWAMPQAMLRYKFDSERPGTIMLDTARLDEWIRQWPEARTYFVFLSVGEVFAGCKMGTPEFSQRVGTWMTAWVRHLREKGISTDRLGLLLVDEPRSHEQDDVIIAWAKAIRAAEPDVLIWEDPVYHDPREGRPEMFAACDVLCPNRPRLIAGGKSVEAFYLAQREAGRELQLYSCSGPARLLDPYTYYRLQAWHCWKIGGTGSFFWAFGDTGKGSSWNEYSAVHGPFTPQFLDAHSVTPAKQMEAIRESVEDYEYFIMLRAAIDRATAAGQTGTALDRARILVTQGAAEVLDVDGASELMWHKPKDRSAADAVRVRILSSLSSLVRQE